jgi:hypothetical protein
VSRLTPLDGVATSLGPVVTAVEEIAIALKIFFESEYVFRAIKHALIE